MAEKLEWSDLATLRKLRGRSLLAAKRSRWPWSWWHGVNASTFARLAEIVEREGTY